LHFVAESPIKRTSEAQTERKQMPYIKQKLRDELNDLLTEDGLDFTPEDAGELNFVISTLVANFVKQHGLNYETCNTVMGALDCARMEFYHRVVRPYEDDKIIENGDVYA
jgi:hypothetical protein